MIKNTYPGKFIAFEGLDGSGQSTQVSLLGDFLTKKGYKVVLTKEPTKDSSVAKRIRNILEKKEDVSLEELQKLFTQDRKEHLNNLIIPKLKEGSIVISDRYFFSTFAYGSSGGLDLDWLIKLNDNFLIPDIVFLLKVSPKTCVKRIEGRGKEKDLFEKEKRLEEAWNVYEILPQRFKKMIIINGEGSVEEVFCEIEKNINSILKQYGKDPQ